MRQKTLDVLEFEKIKSLVANETISHSSLVNDAYYRFEQSHPFLPFEKQPFQN